MGCQQSSTKKNPSVRSAKKGAKYTSLPRICCDASVQVDEEVLMDYFGSEAHRQSGLDTTLFFKSVCDEGEEGGGHIDSGVILNKLRATNSVYRICLTGGPCAGKSSCLSQLQGRLPHFGFKVFCVPEAATLLMTAGLDWANATSEQIIQYQLALLQTQIALEDNITEIAKACKQPCVVLCDRGTMDGRAYASDEQWSEIMRRSRYTLESLRDLRYDAVIHLVSCAIGAESFYNFDNPVRFESVEGAKKADEHLRNMYIGHPRLKIIDNSTNFEKKLDRVLAYVCDMVGHTTVPHRRKRFLLKEKVNESDIDVPFVRLRLTITVLNAKGNGASQSLLVKREEGKSLVFIYQINKKNEEGEKVAEEHRISAREYQSLRNLRDMKRVEVVKDNISFMWGDFYCEVGTFKEPEWVRGTATVYADCTTVADLPPFLKVDSDVTNDPSLSTYEVSRPLASLTSALTLNVSMNGAASPSGKSPRSPPAKPKSPVTK